MWQSQKTIYNRTNGTVKSAIQKFARRGMVKETIGTCLELFEGNNGKAVMERLKIICVEDKFPQGSQYIHWFNDHIKKWKKFDNHHQRALICAAASKVALLDSDRHIAYLAKVALHHAETNDFNGLNEEEKTATKIERLVLRLRKKKELVTPQDINQKKVIHTIKQQLFGYKALNPIQRSLWETFEKSFFKENKTTSRLFLYTLVGLKFHGVHYLPNLNIPQVRICDTTCIDLPDFVYDKHTSEGKKRKRGLQHFLEVGAYIENPHKDIEKRQSTKRKAEELYMEDEKKYGTKQTNSLAQRKRVRRSFLKPTSWKGNPIVSIEVCQKPCGLKPPTWILETLKEKVFVKGPFDSKKKLEFQLKMDEMKWKYGIKPVGYRIQNQNGLFWLYSQVHEGSCMSPMNDYTDEQMLELIKILIFRGINGCSDTHLRNIMVLNNGEILSVDEMTYKPRSGHLLDFMFSKKPNKFFLNKMLKFLSQKQDMVEREFRKHGEILKSFNLEFLKHY
jgi:hypothetical protein